MERGKLFTVVLSSLILLGILSFVLSKDLRPNVSAHSSSNDWTSGKDLIWVPDNYSPGFYISGSYYYTDTTFLRWNTTSANNIKNSGHRYTQDNTDGAGSCSSEHFTSTGNWGTNFPNPDYDQDNDTWYCNTSAEEAEITSDYLSFPTPGTNYFTTMQWRRVRSGTGQMYFTSQLSNFQLLEWNTAHYDLLYTRNYTSSGAMKNFPMFNCFTVLSSVVFADSTPERNFTVEQNIQSKTDLESYKNSAIEKLGILRLNGVTKANVVVTFSSPQSPDRFTDFLKVNSISLQSFEMRAYDSSGQKITLGGTTDPLKAFEEMKQSLALSGLDGLGLNGVISFKGAIDVSDYEKLNGLPNIYLVDVTPEAYFLELKSTGEIEPGESWDINVNDLYWYLEQYHSGKIWKIISASFYPKWLTN